MAALFGCALSRASKGSAAGFGGSGALLFSTLMPFAFVLAADTGVNIRDGGLLSSLKLPRLPRLPKRTSDSTVRSIFPFMPFKTVEFLLMSLKPISRSATSFVSKSSSRVPTLEPKTLEALLILGDARPSEPLSGGDTGGVYFSIRCCCGYVELDERRLKPNRFVGLGGSGGGCSSIELVLVLPVSCRAACLLLPPGITF